MLSSFIQKSSVQMELMALVKIPFSFPVPSFRFITKKGKALLITIICSKPPSPQVWAKLIFAARGPSKVVEKPSHRAARAVIHTTGKSQVKDNMRSNPWSKGYFLYMKRRKHGCHMERLCKLERISSSSRFWKHLIIICQLLEKDEARAVILLRLVRPAPLLVH